MGYMINGLCMNETDGCRFIKWRTLSDFECNAKKRDAVRILCKCGISYKGIIFDVNESELYLKTDIRIGSPLIGIVYEDIINVELLRSQLTLSYFI